MKIAIVGAGAMGSLYGAYLSQKHEVILLDTFKPQVDAINTDGITIVEKNGDEQRFINGKAYISGEYKEQVDVVILFVKATFTEVALASNQHLFGENTLVVTLQNGAGNDRKIAKYVKNENIIIGTSKHNAVSLEPGKVSHPAIGVTTIGSNEEDNEAIYEIEKLLSECGFEAVVSKDIQRIIWSKLFVNLSVNTLTALTETPIGYMIKDQHAWEFAKRLIYEAVDVAEADGTYFDRREALESVRKVCQQAGDGYSSMFQDRKNRVKMEIDAINGAIVEQAKLYGVPTPYNTIIVDLIHAIEGAYEFD